MTRKTFLATALLLAFSMTLFGHAGEVHSYMGTITAAGNDGAYTMKTTRGEAVDFVTAPTTRYRFADNSAAKESDLRPGVRAVVEISKDGRTATSIKIAK
jgi:hypothetical protein